ncbi:MAG: Uncharacterised protein [Oceanospirillaceae bacterium UBA2001]|nr:MAG: Uncharacterised protein [Oceanospirillaceae bacterium UBA2001]
MVASHGGISPSIEILRMNKHIYKTDEYGIRNYSLLALGAAGVCLLYSVIGVLAMALLHFEASAVNTNINAYVDAFWPFQIIVYANLCVQIHRQATSRPILSFYGGPKARSLHLNAPAGNLPGSSFYQGLLPDRN